MFKKILIANRGEVALRIIRTCREVGIETVAVFSEADRGSLHVCMADEAYCVGPAASLQSYLNRNAILKAAKQSGAQAIHPGYGFFSENAEFAEACRSQGIVFIGPTSEVIRLMGDKNLARKTMLKAGVPVIPGSSGSLDDADSVVTEGKRIGFPFILKAVAGGGGKGMRVVRSDGEIVAAYDAVRREAFSSFADNRILLEKYFEEPRHIEVQVLADQHGNVKHLYERECSIQRRYQKIVEESPSVFVDDDFREKLTAAAISATQVVGYAGAGTIEFLVDRDKSFYFLEMNTRIQVEHSVTEMITGVDIVMEQLNIAAGQPISFIEETVPMNGWAIECRIYAEDPENDYLPSAGRIKQVNMPTGPYVRIDSSIYSGWEVTPYYDPMLLKLTTWGRDREEARRRMLRALKETIVYGVTTNMELLKFILASEDFIQGRLDTRFLQRNVFSMQTGLKKQQIAVLAAICSRVKQKELADSKGNGASMKKGSAWKMAGKYQFWATRF